MLAWQKTVDKLGRGCYHTHLHYMEHKMARKTEAEQAAEREEALATQEAHDFAAYPSRLMAALELATTQSNYELEVRDSQFTLRDRDARRPELVVLTHTHTAASQRALDNLEWDLGLKAAERALVARRTELKQAALSKLTEEEREALDL